MKAEYEREKDELNQILDEHNQLASLLKQADTYYRLSKKKPLTEAEQLQKTICWKSMETNGIMYRADHDRLRNKVERLSKKISARKESLEGCKQKLDVFLDLANTFYEISAEDYLEKLEREERERKEREAKKRRKSL